MSSDIESRVDLDRLKELSADDIDFIKMLLLQFLEDAEDRLSKLKEAIQSSDFESQKYQAHAIRGASQNLGCFQLIKPSENLEYDPKASEKDFAERTFETLSAEFLITKAAVESYCSP